MGQDPRDIERQIEETREHMGDTVSALSYKADVPTRMKDSVSDKKDAVIDRVSGLKDSVAGSGGSAASTTKDAASQAGGGAKRAVGIAQENPLGLAVGAIAAGFLIGSLLPSTQVEDEKLGPVATEVRGQVADLASEAVEHGTQVAKDAAGAASDAAKESGTEHAQELSASAKESVGETADQVRS